MGVDDPLELLLSPICCRILLASISARDIARGVFGEDERFRELLREPLFRFSL